jgi:hypothetical protein
MNLMLAPVTPNKWHGTVVPVSPVPQQTEPAAASLAAVLDNFVTALAGDSLHGGFNRAERKVSACDACFP